MADISRDFSSGSQPGIASILRRPSHRQTRASARFAYLQELFDKSFKAARVGIWECRLPEETLTWTDTVYELFDLVPQSPLNRAEIVALYTPESRVKLSECRSAAIRDGEGFTLDAEIVTAKGNRRWIRITAIVERADGEPFRIFGMKQDITAEKISLDHIRRLTEIDALTGLASRAKFEAVLAEACTRPEIATTGLLLIDLDGFKAINDTLGHQAGDQCLKHVGERIVAAVPDAELVARIGGDEFAVIQTCTSVQNLRDVCERVVDGLAFRMGPLANALAITASVGGTLIVGGTKPKDVFACADAALYAVKAEGKNGAKLFSV